MSYFAFLRASNVCCILALYVTFLGAIMTIFQQFYEPNSFGVPRKSRKLCLWEAQFIRVLRIQWLFVCLFVFVLFQCFLPHTLIWKLVHTGQSICTLPRAHTYIHFSVLSYASGLQTTKIDTHGKEIRGLWIGHGLLHRCTTLYMIGHVVM